ncbi:OmpA family protein [Actinomadura nitritigenes]|uniref:OmpA family protein n=1 Tax=Actinomadura nitritigenes TaxID=134602 RepID=UPI0036B50F9C
MRSPGRKRTASVAGAVLMVLGLPGVAGADPGVSDEGIRQSVKAIDVPSSVKKLETVNTNGNNVTVRISSDLLFGFDKAVLTDAARQRISQLVPQVKEAVGVIMVSGHSDSIGGPRYNQTLSTERAGAVKAGLEQALGGGFDGRIQAKGFGETRPVAPNQIGGKDNPDGRAQNRRVEITFVKR